jgi:ferredoxin
MDSWLARHVPVSLLLRIDPLVTTVICGGMRATITILMLGLVTLGVTLLLGRVFCGWVCPLGAIFDAYGWVLKKFHWKIEGPSPRWFRLKYYLLIAILIFAVLGGVSPLMGFDPIVLLTRTAAAVLMPFARHKQEITWHVGGNMGYNGYFIDFLTLGLFLAIMTGTTKLSRIWCRTACPLGAYLAVSSRHAVLRRETKNCIQCGICSLHCPTGAIDLRNAEVYNESECIKCFLCSQACPVDANFFTLKSPLPSHTASYSPVSLDRRVFLGTAAATVTMTPVLNLAAGLPKSQKSLLRPPLSREEHDFLASCIRCGECMKACPTGVLKPAGFEHGLRALWTPVMVPTEGPCLQGCNACSQACPTDAIMKYPIQEKYSYKAGTAIFSTDRCISYTENKFCSECVRACPTDAINFEKGWEPPPIDGISRGSDTPAPKGQKPTRPISINIDRCVACGGCEYSCNQIVYGEPAMITTSFGRASPTSITKRN